jgi:hypothetical protein
VLLFGSISSKVRAPPPRASTVEATALPLVVASLRFGRNAVNFLIATATFVDPSDGQMINAGRIFVSAGSDVARSHRRNFKPATGHGLPSGVYRGRVETKRRPRTNSSEEPSWLLPTEHKPWRL